MAQGPQFFPQSPTFRRCSCDGVSVLQYFFTSAYSLFNKDYERIAGSFGNEHFEQNLRQGGPMYATLPDTIHIFAKEDKEFLFLHFQPRLGMGAGAAAATGRPNAPAAKQVESKQTLSKVNIKQPPNAPCHCGSGKKFKKCHGDPSVLNEDDYDDLSD
jgi:hypothetical protein